MTRCYFEEGYQETPVFLLEELACDHSLPGPAIIIDTNRWGMGTCEVVGPWGDSGTLGDGGAPVGMVGTPG